ncbi:MAG: antibiotic biosynthesis monooxygenase [Acidimicrobiales bacterium]|nr:antibiotic biosynthesis monooxygenase [Acidimicrobiales bacterium]
MIIVTGSVVVRPESLDEAVALSLEHVRRSRAEPGCLRHSVHRDVEDPNRLVFLEYWADRAALDAHFAVPASRELVQALAGLATTPPEMDIHLVAD